MHLEVAYQCRVAGFNNTSTGPYSDLSEVVTPSLPTSGIPTNVHAEAGPGSAEVRFTVDPDDDGGFPVVGYQASCARVGGGKSSAAEHADGAGSPIVVVGLELAIDYRCRVAARYADATGRVSDRSEVVAPFLPTSGIPTNVHAEAGPGSAEVRFTVDPDDDGGFPVVGYRARCRRTNGGKHTEQEIADGQGSPIAVLGLELDRDYRCSAAAVYAGSAGLFSEPSEVATPVLPNSGVPTGVHADAGPGSAQVRFTVDPDDDGGFPVLGYQALCRRTSGAKNSLRASADAAESPITVTGLDPGRNYRCRVAAVYAGAVGRFSNPSEVLTPT